ncbi:MAG: hypothetical protein ACI9UR_002002, partial [Bacteroidia bacterium]
SHCPVNHENFSSFTFLKACGWELVNTVINDIIIQSDTAHRNPNVMYFTFLFLIIAIVPFYCCEVARSHWTDLRSSYVLFGFVRMFHAACS